MLRLGVVQMAVLEGKVEENQKKIRNIVKKYILNQNEILEKQYYGGLNPIWYYCVDNIEDYKKCKTQCSSVNYALANQYIELVKNNMSIKINDINRGCDL